MKNMAKKLKSGHILRIPLLHNWGFAYAKYINIMGNMGNNSYPDLIKVYDYRSVANEPLEANTLNNYLMQPLLFAGRLVVMREQRWSIVGEASVFPEDEKLPDLRLPTDTISDRMIVSRPPQLGATFYTKNLALRPSFETALVNVEHLEFLSAYSFDTVEASITMCFMLSEGVEIGSRFDLQAPDSKHLFSLYGKRPLANKLPPHLYGRARQPSDENYVSI